MLSVQLYSYSGIGTRSVRSKEIEPIEGASLDNLDDARQVRCDAAACTDLGSTHLVILLALVEHGHQPDGLGSEEAHRSYRLLHSCTKQWMGMVTRLVQRRTPLRRCVLDDRWFADSSPGKTKIRFFDFGQTRLG